MVVVRGGALSAALDRFALRRMRLQAMRIIKTLLLTFLCVTALLSQLSCLRDSYSVKLSGPVTLGENWIEFNPKPALKPDKDWQEVGLELEQPFNDDFFD